VTRLWRVSRPRFGVFGAILFVAAVASADDFIDDVDLQIRGKETVDGTLQPANERETFLVDLPAGARVTASVKRTGKSGLVPKLDLLQGATSDAVVASGKASASGAKLTSFPVAASDVFRLRVAGDGAQVGDYRLGVTISPQRTWSQKADAELAAGADATFPFSAPAGATIDATLTPAKGSKLLPRIVEVDGPGGFAFQADAATATTRRHAVKGVALGAVGGDFTVRVRNIGADAGAWTLSVRVKPARLAKASFDLRDSDDSGTTFAGGLPVFGRVIDAAGGLIDPAVAGNPLEGASIDVPPNAVSSPTIFMIQSSDDVPAGGVQNHAAGVAVKLLPAGPIFGPPVTVKISFDPQAFDDPQNEITVTTQDQTTLQVTDVPRGDLVIDTLADTVSFPASHFSRFQGFSPRPRPVKGPFVQLELGGAVTAGGAGSVTFGLSRLTGLKGPRSGNGFARALNRRTIRWDPTSVAWDVVAPAGDPGVVTVQDDGDVTLTDSIDGAVQYVRGQNGDVLIRRSAPDSSAAATSFLLRVAPGAPNLFNVAGDWNAFVLEASAQHFAGANAYKGLNLTMGGQVLQLTFGLDGKATARSSVKYGAIADDKADLAGVGQWDFNNSGGRALPAAGALAFPADGSNTVQLTMPLGFRTNLAGTVTLHPVLRGDMLVGVADTSDLPASGGALARLVVLVRARNAESRDLKHPLVGDSLFAAFGLRAVDLGGLPPTTLQGIDFVADDFVATHGVGHVVTYAGRRDVYSRDASGAPTFVSDAAFSSTGKFTVSTDGVYAEKRLPLSGAVTVHGNVFVATRFVQGELSLGFGVVEPR